MKFVFTEKKISIPEQVKAYAEKKIGKLERYFRDEVEATVVFSEERSRQNAEVTIRSGGTIIRVSESTYDMYVTIDAAVASIERQLRKNKARLEKRLRKDAFDRTPTSPGVYGDAGEPEDNSFDVVRTKHFFFAPMTVEEAILQMNLVGHTFFAFRNADASGAFSVVYRRHDGGYGLLVDTQ